MYAIGTDVTTSTESSGFDLGSRFTDNEGKEYIYVHANGAIVAADVVLIDEAYEADQIDTTNSASGFGQVCGVALGAFTDNYYGWVQIYGVVSAINVASSCAANIAINSTATAGRLDDDATVGAEVVNGIVLTTAETTGNTAPGFLSYPTVGATL